MDVFSILLPEEENRFSVSATGFSAVINDIHSELTVTDGARAKTYSLVDATKHAVRVKDGFFEVGTIEFSGSTIPYTTTLQVSGQGGFKIDPALNYRGGIGVVDIRDMCPGDVPVREHYILVPFNPYPVEFHCEGSLFHVTVPLIGAEPEPLPNQIHDVFILCEPIEIP